MPKFIHYLYQGKEAYGLLETEDRIRRISGDPFSGYQPAGGSVGLAEIKILPPCRPGKIIALGLNYRDHAREFNLEVPAEPLIFMKPPSAVIAAEEKIIIPAMSRQVDYEAELAVIIGRTGRNISREAAFSYILGYTCLNDVTARDLQTKDGQWTRAKGFDTFCPIGPCLVTDIDPGDLAVQSYCERGTAPILPNEPVDLFRRGTGGIYLRGHDPLPGRYYFHGHPFRGGPHESRGHGGGRGGTGGAAGQYRGG